MSDQSKSPAPPAGFISEGELLKRLPVCRRTLGNWKERGLIPYIRLGRRVIYDWDSVRDSLLRQQQGA
jgi:hypothetical protein